MSTLTIEEKNIRAVSPEQETASMPLDLFFEKACGRSENSRGAILPDGVKSVVSEGSMEIWIHQDTPQAHSFQWIAKDSPKPYGKGAKYRKVRIALPYLITLIVFTRRSDGEISLAKHNECFFATQPLSGWDDELCFPALLNCSKFEPQEGKPLAWICSQHIDRSFDAEKDLNKRLRMAFGALKHCLLETGFNYSSEHHEFNSWYSESKSVDPRIETIEAWEEATVEDELFALEVPWLKTGLNLGQIVDRIFSNHQTVRPDLNNANALARLVFNHKQKEEATKSPFQALADSPF